MQYWESLKCGTLSTLHKMISSSAQIILSVQQYPAYCHKIQTIDFSDYSDIWERPLLKKTLSC